MPPGPLTIDALRAGVADRTIDTVVLAIVDIQGRLQGKRFDAEFFIDEVASHGTEGCNYLLAVDIEMNTVGGYAMSSWERGYGDFAIHPDFATMRRIPWQPGTALLLGDARWLDDSPVVESPRQVLQQQVDRLAERGWVALVGTELEFIVFDDSFEAAGSKRYTGLTPANQYKGGYPDKRRLRDPGQERGRAAAAGDPAGHARRGYAGRVGEGRVQPRPA